jgi:uncharacterized protein (DUF4415 family)
MRKGADIRTYTADEIRAMRRRGEDRTDWAKVDAMTQADLERAIALDADERDLEPDWTRAQLVMPRPRQSVHLRLDLEVVEFFKAGARATSPACRRSCGPMWMPTSAGPGDHRRTTA